MKISDGDFGFKTPGTASAPAVGPASFVQQGVPELAAAGLKIGGEQAQSEAQDAQFSYSQQREKRVEAEMIAKEAKRAEAMTIHARAQNDLAAAHDQLKVGIQDGSVPVDAAPKAWAETSQKIIDEHMKTVDRSNVELVRAGLVGNVGTFGRSLNEAVVAKNRHEIGAKLADYLEQMQRFGLSDLETAKKQGVMAIDAQGPLAGYNAEQVQKMRQGFIEGVTFNDASQRLTGAMNSMPGLDQFLKDLPAAADLDPKQKNILESKAMTLKTHLENRAVAADNRKLTQLKVAGDRLETRISMGIPIPDRELSAYQDLSKGTVFEEFANGLADEQKGVAEVLRKPPAEQAAFVAQLEQNLTTKGEGNPRMVARLQKTVAHTIKLVNENPVQYAMDRSGAAIEPLDMLKPDSWGANLAHRAEVIEAQNRQVGGGRGVLLPQESAVLARILEEGTPETKKSYLEPLRRAVGNDAIFRSTVQQFAKDSPVTALAAVIATKESPITVGSIFKEAYQPGDTSMKILQGEHLLNPTKGDKAQDGKGRGFPMPHGNDAQAMDRRFADAVGEVFADSPDSYRTQLQAARAYYAATLSGKGNYSGELDNTVWAQSIAATLPVGRFNGKPVSLPWGMDEGTFKNHVANAFPQALKAAGLPPEVAQATGRFTLQNLSGTRYIVRQGTEDLTGPKGKVVIEVPENAASFRDVYGKRIAQQVPD